MFIDKGPLEINIGDNKESYIDDASTWLLESIHSQKPVNGLTHKFYRYPARFSPEFARSIIQKFSSPGDTILDPFMGGGTTVIEGVTLGRRIIGIDLNSLAVFIARVKSTPLSPSEIDVIRNMMRRYNKHPFIRKGAGIELKPLFKNVPWWIRNCILAILHDVMKIRNRRVRDFLRCGLLKTAQWALDCREIIPSSQQFFYAFSSNINEMCNQMEEYRTTLHHAGFQLEDHISKYRRLLLRSAMAADQDRRIPIDWLPIKLVVTSPPYPGVHVLYHRWQIQGRKETPAPFAILNSLNGHPESYYTFGDRHHVQPYFKTLTAVYRSIRNLLSPSSLVVQLISFNNPKRDISRFLYAMEDAGFEECSLKDIGLGTVKRIWRKVPNRRWYAGYKINSSGKELLLFHRAKST